MTARELSIVAIMFSMLCVVVILVNRREMIDLRRSFDEVERAFYRKVK